MSEQTSKNEGSSAAPAEPAVPNGEADSMDMDEPKVNGDAEKKRKKHEGETAEERAERKRRKKEKKAKKEKKKASKATKEGESEESD